MKDKILNIYKKYDSYISYIFFGVLTTLINVIVYYLFSKLTAFGTVINTIIAWVAAVLFAFFTNRKWVFKSENTKKAEIFNEAVKFFLCRILTGILDVVIMYVFVDILKCNDLLIKIISNVIVIIVNFVASKYIIFVKNKNGNLKATYINTGIYILLFALACLFLMNSPLNPIKYGEVHPDSAVFKTIGYLMTKGYVPYRDLFDHKGPLIYLYNYIGSLISYYRGIWVVEVISLFITFIALYKSSRLYLNKFYSIFIILLCVSPLNIYFRGGNLVEEYALPFLSIALYIFLDYFKNKDITKFKIILNGFCFGAVCLLRPNMVSLWIAFCILVLIQKIKEKRLIDVLYFIAYFLIGTAIILLPTCVWLVKADAWNAFINDYIKFNIAYSGYANLSDKIITVLHFIKEPVTTIALVYSIYLIYKDDHNRLFNVFNFIYIFITLLLISISGRVYNHYGMIIIPCILYSYIALIKQVTSNKKNEIATLAIIGYFIITIIIPSWGDNLLKLGSSFDNQMSNSISLQTNQIVDYVNRNTNKKDLITVYGNWNIIYVLTKREPASKYSYVFPIKDVDDKVLPQYFEDLKKNKPKLFILKEEYKDEESIDFLNNNNYKLVLDLKESENRKVYIYQLKEKIKDKK